MAQTEGLEKGISTRSLALDEILSTVLKDEEVGFDKGIFEFRYQIMRFGLEHDPRFSKAVSKLEEKIAAKLKKNTEAIADQLLLERLDYLTAALLGFAIYPYVYGAEEASPEVMAKIFISRVNLDYVRPDQSLLMLEVINGLLSKGILTAARDGRGDYIFLTPAVDKWLI